jgi:large subunit ribosomal protein L21
MFAIIRTGGKQYKVSPGDVVTVEKLPEGKKNITFPEVLLVASEKTLIGKPLVEGAEVTGEIVRNLRGDKIRVFKYQAKSQWSKTKGHRQSLTEVKIKAISEKTRGA